jgi:hypothetical protein
VEPQEITTQQQSTTEQPLIPEQLIPPQPSTTEQRAAVARTPAGYRRCAMRLIRDTHLGMVLVYELEPSVVDSGPRHLVFEATTWASRLEKYPAEWRRLPNDELLALRGELH